MNAEINIRLEIQDPAALRAAAGSDYADENQGRAEAAAEAEDFLGPVESPDLAACVRQLFDKTKRDAGIQITDSHCSVGDVLLRTTTTVNVSVEHITPQELKRINEAFGMEADGPTYRALEDIKHDGLYMSPKDFGFIVRMPSDDTITDIIGELTPEMLAIVLQAHQQGARRIEFDADEQAVHGLPTFEH